MNAAEARDLLLQAGDAVRAPRADSGGFPQLVHCLAQLEDETGDLQMAAKIVTLRLCIERLAGAPLEPHTQIRDIASLAVSALLKKLD